MSQFVNFLQETHEQSVGREGNGESPKAKESDRVGRRARKKKRLRKEESKGEVWGEEERESEVSICSHTPASGDRSGARGRLCGFEQSGLRTRCDPGDHWVGRGNQRCDRSDDEEFGVRFGAGGRCGFEQPNSLQRWDSDQNCCGRGKSAGLARMRREIK